MSRNPLSNTELKNILYLEDLLQCMDDGICILEIKQEIQIIYASPGFYRMIGFDSDVPPLPRPLKIAGIHPDYEAEYEGLLREAAESGSVVHHVQRIGTKNKKWIWRKVQTLRLSKTGSDNPLMLEISTDISRIVEKERQLKESNERLRVAFRQTPHILWEVDLKNRVYGIYDVDNETCAENMVFHNYPESLIANGIVHSDSLKNFQKFADELLKGNEVGSGNFILRDPFNSCYEWAYLSYHMTYDEDGRPVKAIGVQEKLPDITGLNHALFPSRPLPEVLRHHLLARMQINLTADSVEYLWMEGKDRTAWTWGRSYTDILKNGEGNLFIQGQGEEFAERFSREGLLDVYERGERWFSGEYRRVSPSGNIRWMEAAVSLQFSPKSQEVYMFGCFSDCQQRKEWERKLPEEVSRKKENGIYEKQAILEFCRYFAETGDKSLCAMACIEIGDIREGSGRALGETLFHQIEASISFALGTDCVVGTYHESAILAFFPKINSKFDVKRRIEDAFIYTRTVMHGIPKLDDTRFVAGVVLENLDRANAELLTMQAFYMSSLWKNSTMDSVFFPEESENWSWINMRARGQEEEEELTERDDENFPLAKDTRDGVLHCVVSMLTADTLEQSMTNALRCLGEYYHANRIYILVLSDDRKDVTMLYEWVQSDKHSIRQIMSGLKLKKIPLLTRCMAMGNVLFAKSPGGGLFEKDKKDDYWRFIAYPLRKDNIISGFLCVENAREHAQDAAILDTIVPYIIGEQRRFHMQTDPGNLDAVEALSRIPNLRTYQDVVYSMNSDTYSSMGALAIDIPNYSVLNGRFSFEYGRELLSYIVENLNNLFGNGFIFRTWDAEFVVLFPNTILEAFTGRCTRLRTMLQRRYPQQIRLGYTWSDGIFYGKDLVREAKSIMCCDEVSEEIPGQSAAEKRTDADTPGTKRKYLLYMQPKIDMRDGSLVGAEALAREVDEKGHILSPAQFIEPLEKNGRIRELDFYMLESVLRQLSSWKKEGLTDIPVSVNISRLTILNPTVLASVLAIYSHYPEIDPGRVELEITETLKNVEKSTLAQIVDEFRAYGIGCSLDDFGSHYANVSIFSNIRFNTIKLDRSLIRDITSNEISRMMVENIAGICKSFGMQCIAEGVETKNQEEVLLKTGCQYAQGYYYARPMPVWKFEEEYLRHN